MSLNSYRNTIQMAPFVVDRIAALVKGNVHIQQGALVVGNAGYAAPGTAATGLRALGRADEEIDNTGGADGAKSVTVRRGTFKWDNSVADPVTQADLAKDCYVEDDHTVSKTDALATRSRAGRVIQVDTDGVWVETYETLDHRDAYEISFPIAALSSIAAGQVMGAKTMKRGGRILEAYFIVDAPVTTALKLATLTPRINGTGVTGAGVALTSANCTPKGAIVQASATALNTFNPGDTIDVAASAVTTFIEGSGSYHIVIG